MAGETFSNKKMVVFTFDAALNSSATVTKIFPERQEIYRNANISTERQEIWHTQEIGPKRKKYDKRNNFSRNARILKSARISGKTQGF